MPSIPGVTHMGKIIRRLILVLSLAYLVGFVLLGRSLPLASLEQESLAGRNAVYLENVDLSKRGTINWTIPRDSWSCRQGDADLSLVVDNVPATFSLKRGGENTTNRQDQPHDHSIVTSPDW